VTAGHKQTELSMIPEHWELTSLGALGSTFGGLTGKTKADFGHGTTRYITFMNVVTNIVINPGALESVDVARTETQNRVARGDLFFNGSSETPEEVGMCAVLADDVEDVLLNSFCFGFRLRNDAPADGMYLAYYFRSGEGRELLKSLAQGSTRYNLSKTALLRVRFPLPPPAEQEAIAEALSDADALIESIDQLLAKKRQFKQGAMQELLTGRRRLPGFSGEWRVKRLGEVLTIAHGKNQRAVEDRNGIYPILATGGQIGTANRFLYDKPSVLIGRKGTIDRPQFMDTPFWTVDTLFYSVIREPNNAKFLFYRLCMIDWKQHNEASGVPSLNARTIERVEIAIPPTVAEQEAIAEALSDADALIESIEQLLAKKRQLKQGAMKELLTGRRRLPGFSAEWEKKRLGALVSLSKEGCNPGADPDALFTHFSLPAFDAGMVPVVEEGRRIGSNKFRVPREAVLMSKLNPRIPRIWMPSHIPENAVCSTEFLVLSPRADTERTYLATLCSSAAVRNQMELHAIGTTGSHQRIHPAQALEIEVSTTHDKVEQTGIAAVASDMDVEIAALEAKLDKARAMKQGMMQELLTGRIRLV
jgi:type I restriction enzyme, S subunit